MSEWALEVHTISLSSSATPVSEGQPNCCLANCNTRGVFILRTTLFG